MNLSNFRMVLVGLLVAAIIGLVLMDFYGHPTLTQIESLDTALVGLLSALASATGYFFRRQS